jgi:fumarate hydratase class II
MGMIKRAAAEVNKSLGMIESEKANAIIQVAQEVIDGKWNEKFVVNPFQAGAETIHHINTRAIAHVWIASFLYGMSILLILIFQ